MKTIDELMCLQNKKVIVIGGAGHIGASACDALAELGAKLAVLDRQKGRHANYICDLKSDLESRSVLQQAMQDLGGLDILIHCAAYVGAAPIPGWKDAFERQTVLAWEEAMRVNLTSIFSLIQESAPILQKSTAASVILFSSIYGMVGPDMRLYESTDMANPAAYNASKGAVLQMTRYLATLLAPKIRVNAISPGGVLRGQPDLFQERYCQRTPLQRMATEEDIKGAVIYLASDLSRYVTGHNLVVDGGYTIW